MSKDETWSSTAAAIFPYTQDTKRAQILVEALGKPALLALEDLRRSEANRQLAMKRWTELAGTRVKFFEAARGEELPAVFEGIVRQKASGLVVLHNPFTGANAGLIAELASKHRLAVIADGRGYARAGLMLTYSTDLGAISTRTADYVARILRGTATPAELPVEHASRFRFVINQRVAREFGVRRPRALLASADEVIE